VESRVQALQEALGLTPLQARRLIVQEPLWLIASLAWLRQQLEQLAAIYQAPYPRLLQMMQQCPHLLLAAPGTQRAKIQQAAAALGAGEASVAAVYRHSPALLSWRVGTLVDKVQRLQGAMGLGAAEVLAIAAASSLLYKRTEAVGLRWAQLQRCAGRCARWAQEWQGYTWSTRACLLLKSARFHARWAQGPRAAAGPGWRGGDCACTSPAARPPAAVALPPPTPRTPRAQSTAAAPLPLGPRPRRASPAHHPCCRAAAGCCSCWSKARLTASA
jgi:hypothetical protein